MKKITRLLGVLVVVVSASAFISCGGDKHGLVKIKGGKLNPDMVSQMELKFSDIDAEAKESGELSFTVGDFYISKFEVTQKLFKEVLLSDLDANPDPAYFNKEPQDKEVQELRPVERITWYDCLYFCNKLSEKEGLEPVYTIENIERYSKDKAIKRADVTVDFTKNGYRLPTHAEWVYAACGGAKAKKACKYSGSEDISEVAWHANNSDEMTHQVGLKKPNELGLYDMTGNVAEWCWDYFWSDEFENKNYDQYTGPEKGRYRYIKGGCFVETASGVSFPYEIYKDLGGIQGLRYYNTGFRIARNAK